ncbi:MAG TPA: SRPBCC domain-containing protein [Deinococcales bacterium]|nr:SRPBCC domain-containing protein [Deinococcales bacterium]
MPDSFTVTRRFPVPRERVFDAWTRPELFARWFGTEAVDVPLESVVLDARVGGEWRAVMYLPDDSRINWVGEYTEVRPPERLAFTMSDDPSAPAGDPITVDLREVAGGTEMTVTQPRGDFSDEQVEQTIAGYNGFFDAMEKVLAEEDGR